MSGPEFMNSAGMWGAVPNATFNASTLFGFLRFTKDLVLSRRRFMFLLVVLGGAFGALNRKISARERLKVRDASPVPCRRDGLSLSLPLPLSLSLRLSARLGCPTCFFFSLRKTWLTAHVLRYSR